MDITGKKHQVFIIFNKKVFESSLKKMSISLVFYIIPACVRSSKPLHAFRNIGLIGFEEQMVVVIHENIGINLNLKPFRHVSQNLQKRNTIIVISKNVPLLISP